MKKEYKKPALKVVKIEHSDLICTSGTATSYSINYDDEDEVPTVRNSLWDR